MRQELMKAGMGEGLLCTVYLDSVLLRYVGAAVGGQLWAV